MHWCCGLVWCVVDMVLITFWCIFFVFNVEAYKYMAYIKYTYDCQDDFF